MVIWRRTYGIGSFRERERNPLPPHGLLFPISSNRSFICIIPDRITHTTNFVTPVVEHWLEREIAQWVHLMKDRSDDPSHHERTLLPQSYISLLASWRHTSLCEGRTMRGKISNNIKIILNLICHYKDTYLFLYN